MMSLPRDIYSHCSKNNIIIEPSLCVLNHFVIQRSICLSIRDSKMEGVATKLLCRATLADKNLWGFKKGCGVL